MLSVFYVVLHMRSPNHNSVWSSRFLTGHLVIQSTHSPLAFVFYMDWKTEVFNLFFFPMFLFLISCQVCPSFLIFSITRLNCLVLFYPRNLFPLNCISCYFHFCVARLLWLFLLYVNIFKCSISSSIPFLFSPYYFSKLLYPLIGLDEQWMKVSVM